MYLKPIEHACSNFSIIQIWKFGVKKFERWVALKALTQFIVKLSVICKGESKTSFGSTKVIMI